MSCYYHSFLLKMGWSIVVCRTSMDLSIKIGSLKWQTKHFDTKWGWNFRNGASTKIRRKLFTKAFCYSLQGLLLLQYHGLFQQSELKRQQLNFWDQLLTVCRAKWARPTVSLAGPMAIRYAHKRELSFTSLPEQPGASYPVAVEVVVGSISGEGVAGVTTRSRHLSWWSLNLLKLNRRRTCPSRSW